VTLKRGQNINYRPYAFTEHGILMLSSVLNRGRAIQVNPRPIFLRRKIHCQPHANHDKTRTSSAVPERDSQSHHSSLL